MPGLVEEGRAKVNLTLRVVGRRTDGYHDLESVVAFADCADKLTLTPGPELSLQTIGPLANACGDVSDNLVLKASRLLGKLVPGLKVGAFVLDKILPVAAGIGGGSADAAAALRLLTSLWQIDPGYAEAVAPTLGSDVPACLLSLSVRGEGAGDELTVIALAETSGTPVLLVNPRVPLATPDVFAAWDGVDRGPLDDWRDGRNDLEAPAKTLVPQVETVLAWLSAQSGAEFTRMSGSGATCFSLFDSEEARDVAAQAVPREWWRLTTFLR